VIEPSPTHLGLAARILVCVACTMAGVSAGWWVSRRARVERSRLSGDLARSEAQSREQTRLVARLRSEQRTLYNLSRALPGLVRELNRSDLDPRDIPQHIFLLAEAVFESDQMLLYSAPTRANDESTQELVLVAHKGVGELPASATRIRIGEGKIGWVAENKVEMLTEDWMNLTRTEGRSIEDNHPAMRLEMIGPLVHHGSGRETVLGVLCLGSPRQRPRDEKLMLQMITNLGSIAYMNTRHVSRLQSQANHDGLTRLLNKRFFMIRLGEILNLSERRNRPLAVFLFDIDHFKKYNDLNGHPAGDELLKAIANLVRENIRPGDLACRYGGEEFVIAMPQTDGDAALASAHRLREAIEGHVFPHGDSQPGGRLTISGGVAAYPVDGASSTELIMHADQALYQAKGAGRNRVVRYEGIRFGDGTEDQFLDEPYRLPDTGTPVDR